MTTDMMAFPVSRGIEGMNKLAVFLNAAPLSGDWHFARGSRFDQTMVSIEFDEPAELAPTWKRYCEARGPSLN